MHQPRRTAERHTTAVYEATKPPHPCFSKAAESGGGFRYVCCLLQFRVADRKPGKSGKKRPTAAMMAGLTDHLWNFDEFFAAVMG